MRGSSLLAGALAAGLASAAPVPVGPCGPVARQHEAIELPAERLAIPGRPALGRVGVVALHDETLAPIPFQIDEKRGRRIVLPDGPEPDTDDVPGVLDREDLVVFLACDAGERATAARLEAGLVGHGIQAWREVRIVDSDAGREAFAYVVVGDQPPTTDRRYVEYDAEHDIVRAARYRLGCVQALPTYFALALSGPLGANVLDGVRLRASATLRANLAHWTLDETEGRHRLEAWKAGPVRVVRRSRHQVYLGLGIYLTGGVAHTYFYPQHVFGPGSMKLPFSPAVLFKDITAVGGADFRNLRGWRYHAPGVPPEGFPVDGRMDSAERAFHGTGDWFLLTAGSDALMVVVTMSPELRQAIRLDLLYTDDAEQPAPPEDAPGTTPLVGYRGRDIEQLAAGRYWFQLRILGFTGYRAGDEARALAQVASPLTADLSARSAP